MSYDEEEYGRCWWCIFWNANVNRACRVIEAGGFQLRWYGIAIPWTKNIGIGLLVRRPVPATDERGE